ncbi:MAG: SAM-dependent methyltransferase [Bacteroidota bacterium]
MNKGTLYLIPTLIAEGTSKVINEQVRSTLKLLDYFLVENVRTARRYISALNLGLTIEELEFKELNKNTAHSEITELMRPALSGQSIGILSESGCPGVADPGAQAVSFAHRNGIKVMPLVGPSSILLALMGSGLNGQKFTFQGYLPIKSSDLRITIGNLERSSTQEGFAHIFIEAPYRNQQLFSSLINMAKEDTLLCVARDLTGSAEYVKTMTIKEWKNEKLNLRKTPTIFILQGPP